MITVYGPAPEFFETQEAAIQKFNTPNLGIDASDILLVVASIIVVGALWYYSYQISEENKMHLTSATV